MAADGSIRVDTRLDNSKAKVGARDFVDMVNRMTQAANQAGQRMSGSVGDYVTAMNRAKTATRGMAGDHAALAREILKTSDAIRRMEERQELARRKFEAAKEEAVGKAMDKFQRDNAGAEYMPWENEEQALAQLSEDLNRVAQEASDAFGTFEDSSAFTSSETQIEFLRERLAALNTQMVGMGTAGESAAQGVAEVAAAAQGGGWAALGTAIQKGVSGFVRLAGSAAKAALNVAKMAGGAALSFLRRLAAGAKNAAIQLAKLAANAARSGLKKLGGLIGSGVKALMGFNRESQRNNGGLKQGLMAVLKYGLGIRGLFALFRRLRSAISEGLGEIAKRSPEVNKALNSMKGALNALKGSLATAFAPIVTAVAPALSKFINILASAINAIGALIAALTGQKTYQKAVAGLDATGSAASGAADEVKELKRQLAGFDQLEILSAPANGGSGGGGGGGGSGSGLSYSTEEISGGITDFVAKLKELWANADYEGIGREIAGAINGAFTKAKDLISWDALGDKITEAVNAITGIFNGLVDGIDWNLIGETFGTGINTLIRTVNLLLTGIDWVNLGKSFATGLNGLVDTVNWSELGELFANKFNTLISLIKGFAQDFDWGKAGTAFAKTVKGLVNKVSWSDVEAALVAGINGAITALSSAVEGFSWLPKATETFAKTINGIVAKVKWAELGGSLAGLLNTALDALHSAIEAFDWGAAGTAFGKLVSGITSKVKWAELGGSLAQLLNGTVEALRSALSAFDWGEAGKTFAAAVNKLITTVKWAELGGSLAQLLNSALDALHSALAEFNWGEAGTAFATAVSSLLSKVKWAQLGGDLAVLLNGAVAALRSALAAFNWEDAGTTFSDTINALVGTVNWTDLGRLLSESLKSALTWLVAALSQFNFGTTGQDFADVINGFFEDPTLWSKAGETVSTAIKGLFTWGSEFLNNLDVAQISNDIKTFLANVDWAGIGKAIFNFLVAFIRASGSLLVELFKPQPADEEQLQQEVKDFLEGVVGVSSERDFTLYYGLHLELSDEKETWDNIQRAIADALENGGNFVLPIDIDSVPPETVEAVYEDFIAQWNHANPTVPISPEAEEGSAQRAVYDFIQKWNASHPNAQIDVDLPGDAGSKVKKAWNKQDTDLPADVDPAIDEDAWSEEWDEFAGHPFEVDVDGTLKPTNTPAEAFNTGTDLSYKGQMSVKTGNDPNTKFKTGTDLGFKGTLGVKDKNDANTKFKTGTDLGFKGTLGVKDKKQAPGAVFAVATALKFVGKLAKKDKNQAPGVVFKVATALKFVGKLAKKDKDQSPGVVFKVATALGFKGTLKKKDKKQTPAHTFGTSLTAKGTLEKKNSKQTPAHTFGTSMTAYGKLENADKTKYTPAKIFGTTLTVVATLSSTINGLSSFVKTIVDKVKDGIKNAGNAEGGVISNGGHLRRFARGGVISGGLARYLSSVPHYASGTTRAHGTVFVAGEAGPEIMGHINGRTEILNKSQLAQAIYSAVVSGMGRAVNALGSFLSARMGECANAIVETIGNVAAMPDLSGLAFRAPAMASGTVMPYEVAAQVARTGEDIQRTLNANNEDLIQTIISVAGQLVAAVGRIQPGTGPSGAGGSLAARQVIEQINRQTRMFGASPLEGV